jgi:four helix bundle protein
MKAAYRGYRDLRVYSKSFELAKLIFKSSKGFPAEERYSLTDQMRRSSRSIVANIAEAWSKRNYPKNFVSLLSDAAGETFETEVRIEMAQA